MAYPLNSASSLLVALDTLASADSGNAFLGNLEPDPRGAEYRSVKIDIPRAEWRRLQPKLFSAGWRSFGADAVVHDLPDGCYVIAVASF